MLPVNWDAVTAFCLAATQWHYGPSGQPTGLDYPAVKLALQGSDLKWPAVRPGLQVLEAKVITIRAKAAKAELDKAKSPTRRGT